MIKEKLDTMKMKKGAGTVMITKRKGVKLQKRSRTDNNDRKTEGFGELRETRR